MSEPYLGEIRMVGFNFTPVGFLACNGSLQPISGNESLYQLLGTTYGGDGQSTFGLPDLQGRVVVNRGTGSGLTAYVLGQKAGSESVTLNANQNPAHNHPFVASNASATQSGPGGAYPANTGAGNPYYTTDASALVPLAPASVAPVAGGQPHENRMPFLTVNFIIASEGIFPAA